MHPFQIWEKRFMEVAWSERILFGGMKEWTLQSHQTLRGQIAFPRSPSNFPATLHATCSYESNLREEETKAQLWSDLPKATQLKQGTERSRTACPWEDGWHVGRTDEISLSLSLSYLLCPLCSSMSPHSLSAEGQGSSTPWSGNRWETRSWALSGSSLLLYL